MFSPEFYRCDICGNLVWFLDKSAGQPVCCGEPMRRLTVGETDGAREKHVPVTELQNNTLLVQIGESLHPATESHSIEWIALQTDKGMFFREIPVGRAPVAEFDASLGTPVAVYCYCNLHGLWGKALGTGR